MTGEHRLPALEAVRGVAALAVVAYHAALAFVPPAVHRRGLPGTNVWHNGDLAVQVFFVLSGLVLTLKFFRTLDPAVLASAAVRRYPRLLLPVAASVALGWGLQHAGLMPHERAAELRPAEYRADPYLVECYRRTVPAFAAVKEAFLHAFLEYGAVPTSNGVLWSMEVEFTGSLLVFGLAGVIRPRRGRGWLYAAVAAVLLKYHYFFFFHMLVGVVLSDLLVSGRVRHGWWAVPLLPVGLVVGDFSGPARHLGAPLIVAAAAFSPFWAAGLSARPLVFLGRVSFCVYLFHMPLLFAAGSWAYCLAADGGTGPAGAAAAGVLATVASTLGLAWLGTVTLDNGSIRLARWVDATVFPVARKPAAVRAASGPSPGQPEGGG